jgi:hypothetical protein
MARISPLNIDTAKEPIKAAFKKHVEDYKGRITNMKATLGHSPICFEAYMQWYPLYKEVERILGKRLAYLYAYAISKASQCPLCATFFRKIIIDAGETPENLVLTNLEENVLHLGSSIVRHNGNIADLVYDAVARDFSEGDMVNLIAFAGQMVATNIFNNVIETDIDDYLHDYLPGVKQI